MKTHDEMVSQIASLICKKDPEQPCENCSQMGNNHLCKDGICKIDEKTCQQLKYILSDLDKNIFLSACPGSGKTEVVAIKAAYEIAQWTREFSGITFLTFTNNAKDVILDRVQNFLGNSKLGFPHYIGTIDSWIHSFIVQPLGHCVTEYQGREGDFSFQIIDENSKSGFLNNFQTRYPYGQLGNIKANQYYYDLNIGKFIFSSNNQKTDEKRNQLELLSNQKDELGQIKNNFFNHGFATFPDMEYIAYKIVCDKDSGEKISQRFPVIIIDECQDLTGNQLKILEKLIGYGSHVHFIGDLNQSIYSFNGVYREKINEFLEGNGFNEQFLQKSFRCEQKIIDVCQKLVNEESISGNENLTTNLNPIYILYEDHQISKLPEYFEKKIDDIACDYVSLNNSAILAKNYKLINEIRNTNHFNESDIIFLLPYAIFQWKQKDSFTLSQYADSLDYIGKFISRKQFHKCSFNSREQYRPEFVESSVKWRTILKKALDKYSQDDKFNNFSLTWKDYAKNIRDNLDIEFKKILDEENITVPSWVELKISFRSPGRKAKSKVKDIISLVNNQNYSPVRITTIHKIKGETLDAAMLVSSKDNRGRGGKYWEDWLEDAKHEYARFAYVASSRPRHLLIWAIPQKSVNEENRQKLAELGFNYSEMDIE
jgi:DNA helicase-2/ATP-dependent DNA helicase PcrA